VLIGINAVSFLIYRREKCQNNLQNETTGILTKRKSF